MLKDLQPIRIPITLAGNKTYLRYNNTAKAYLEHFYPNYNEFMSQDTEEMPIVDLMHLLRAGLIDSFFAENEKFLDNFDYENVYPRMSNLGKILNDESRIDIMQAITDAFLSSLPISPVGAENFQMGEAK